MIESIVKFVIGKLQIWDGTNNASVTAGGALKTDASATTQPVSGTVTAAQGTAAALNGKWPVQVTDGTNTLPTMDTVGRAGFHKLTDGTNTTAVKAASTAAAATDPAVVVSLSPNSPLPAGTNALGSVTQGGAPWSVSQSTAAALAGAWPVKVTDGTNTLPTMDTVGRAAFYKLTDGTNTTAVKAASTAAATTDPSAVVALSPNSPLPAGSSTIGAVNQGNAAALANKWPVQVTDGTNTLPTMDAVGRAGFHKLTDGTNTTAVKAASTAAAAADPSAVVALSPNSPLPAGSSTIGAVNQGTAAALASKWPVQVTDGTNTMPTMDVVGRAAFVKLTDGTNTAAVKAASTAAAAADPSAVVALSPNTALPTGTNSIGTVKSQLQDNAGTAITVGQKTMASSIPVVIPSDQSAIPFTQSAPTPVTYSAAVTGLVAAAAATDIFTITGSATKTIQIIRIGFTATASSGISTNFLLIKRSNANSGGTFTTQTNVPHDSNDAAGTATVKAYTVNPTTLGTTVGTIRSARLLVPPVSAGQAGSPINYWEFDNLGKLPVLRGTAETLALNLNAATVTGSVFDFDIEWIEL